VRIIFLDMDGVMNSMRFRSSDEAHVGFGIGFGASQIDPKACVLLDKLVEDADAHIVISSSWRHIWGHEEIGKMLEDRGFQHRGRVIGATPRGRTGSRGEEVQAWLDLDRERRAVEPERSPITAYVILDDDSDFAGELREHFVHTDQEVGLTKDDVKRALKILAQG
jgi:hypothetical protein